MSIRIKTTLKQFRAMQKRHDLNLVYCLLSFQDPIPEKWHAIYVEHVCDHYLGIYNNIWQHQLWSFKFDGAKLDEMSAKYIWELN